MIAEDQLMIDEISTQVFADGADLDDIAALASSDLIRGFTTNPTLMWKAGLTDYHEFATRVLEEIGGAPVSFEVFADDEEGIREQARKIAAWGENVFVKIPVMTSSGESLERLAGELSHEGIRLNVTAIFTLEQVSAISGVLAGGAPSYVSVFAGRIADAGVDPLPIVAEAVRTVEATAPEASVIWASPREVFNLVQADTVGCHVITMTRDLLDKIPGLGKDLEQFSLETVQMFHRDAQEAGYSL